MTQPHFNLSLKSTSAPISTSTLTSTQYGCDIKATQSCFSIFDQFIWVQNSFWKKNRQISLTRDLLSCCVAKKVLLHFTSLSIVFRLFCWLWFEQLENTIYQDNSWVTRQRIMKKNSCSTNYTSFASQKIDQTELSRNLSTLF